MKSFEVEVGVRQGCVMSPWLFNILMDECMREMKCKVVNAGVKLRLTLLRTMTRFTSLKAKRPWRTFDAFCIINFKIFIKN